MGLNNFTQSKYLKLLFLFVVFALTPLLKSDRTLDPNLIIQFCYLSLFLLVYWIIAFTRNHSSFGISNFTAIFLTVYLLFILYSITSAYISSNFSDAIFIFSKYILFFILLLTFALHFNSKNIASILPVPIQLFNSIILIGGAIQLASIMVDKELVIPRTMYNITSVFAHRNLFSEVLFLLVPFNIYQIYNTNRIWRALGFFNVNLSLLLLIIMSNRAAWLALIVCLVAYFIIIVAKGKGISLDKKSKFFLISSTIFLSLGILFLLKYSASASLEQHTLNAFDFRKGSTKDRVELWNRTIHIIYKSPLLGEGLDSWKISMLRYGNAGLASENNTIFYQRPHNDFLWVTAEQGIIGLFFYISLFGLIIFATLKSILSKKNNVSSQLSFLVLFVTLGYLIFSFFSFPKERIIHNILLYSTWGWFLNYQNLKDSSVLKIRSKNVYLMVILALVGILVVGISRYYGEIHTRKGISAKNNSNFTECVNEMAKAKSFFYKVDHTSTPLDWYLALCYYKKNEFSKAKKHYENAYKLNPYHIYILNDYAGCLTRTGNLTEAIKLYSVAITISPTYTDAKLNLCALYVNTNDYFSAFDILKKIDINEDSERYRKTVTVIFEKLIDSSIANRKNSKFQERLKNANNHFDTYKEILTSAIQNNLDAEQVIIQLHNE